MIDFTQFDPIFGSLHPFPYNRAFAQKVDASRKALEGALFVDRVLNALNLPQATVHYPPKNENALRQLHGQICESNSITVHHKLSLIYYIFLDIDHLESPRPDSKGSASQSKSLIFAKAVGIPLRYQIFMTGLWDMDNLAFERALEHLTHPSLISEFADDILTVLVHHSKDGDYTLPLAYYHTVQPIVQTSEALELLFDALARSNVAEAFDFSRSHADVMRRRLFQKLVLSVLDSARNDESAERAFELTSLPFDAEEEIWFNECLESGEAKKLGVAKDTLLMRRIAMGNAAFRAEKGTWAVVLEGFKKGSGGRV